MNRLTFFLLGISLLCGCSQTSQDVEDEVIVELAARLEEADPTFNKYHQQMNEVQSTKLPTNQEMRTE